MLFLKPKQQNKTSLLIKPDYLDANLNLANIYLKDNKFNKALIYLEKSLKINPTDQNKNIIKPKK